MRIEMFHESLTVELSEEDRQLRARQVARIAVALKAQRAKANAETDAWAERRKELKAEEARMVATLYTASEAAETGREERPVECREILRGVMVETVRCDTSETVSARSAEAYELAEHEAPLMVPGGGSARAAKGKAKRKTAADVDGIVEDDYAPH
jgi:phage-related protein